MQENNLWSWDASSTERYQRDNILHFLWCKCGTPLPCFMLNCNPMQHVPLRGRCVIHNAERCIMPSLIPLQLLAEILVRDCCGATAVCNLSEALWTCGSSVCCRHLGVVSFSGGNSLFPIVRYAVCRFSQPLWPSHSQNHFFSTSLCSLPSYAPCCFQASYT